MLHISRVSTGKTNGGNALGTIDEEDIHVLRTPYISSYVGNDDILGRHSGIMFKTFFLLELSSGVVCGFPMCWSFGYILYMSYVW